MQYKKKIVLRFSSQTWNRPIVYRLASDFKLEFNILKAIILPRQEGLMVLELAGTEENFQEGVQYLLSKGVTVEPIEHDIMRDDKSCVHCGACTAVCPTSALKVCPPDMFVNFNPENCVACEQCVRLCPLKAMKSAL